MYIPIDLLRRSDAATKLSPEDISSRKTLIKSSSALELDGEQGVMQRAAMLSAVAPENFEDAFERYIGDNDLLPINFLQIGTRKSRAVGRLRYFDVDVGRDAMATGFLISPDLVLTNHHVFKTAGSFQNPYIDFDYAYGGDGREQQKLTFRLDSGKFFYSDVDLDCALIGIADFDETKTSRASDRGWLILDPGLGKVGNGDYATIIQHPDGSYQQVALRGNQIVDLSPTALIYVTDTSPGSSGSPVFNDQWQVIALHSAGVAKKDASGRYVDKDGLPVPEINGHIDSSRLVWTSNTGMRISSLVKDWFSRPQLQQSPFIQFIGSPGYSDRKPNSPSSAAPSSPESVRTPKGAIMTANESLSLPGNAQGLTININLNFGAVPAVAVPSSAIASPQESVSIPKAKEAATNSVLFESKTTDEQNKDYSDYLGFDSQFMGEHTPLPSLSAQLRKKTAILTSNPGQFVLNYEHYSTIMHAVRCMPVVSAINVEGDPTVRRDKAPRKDTWLRDNRIDFDLQLTDEFYKGSGFDKGHMSRREDAKWGKDAADAEAAAQLTCMYSNACPQVPAINRAVYGYHGLWGQLEQIVLEKGVEAERGDASKICVYNGPVFVDTDPVFKGIQIPMRFFKIIVWRNGAGDMKCTGFILSQEDLVGGIQFEELQYDKEFVTHQCSIAYLENLTQLTFTSISDWDTSPRKGDKSEVKAMDRPEVEAYMGKHSDRAEQNSSRRQP